MRVAEAVARYLLHANANDGGYFETSLESQALLAQAQADFAAFVGSDSADNLVSAQI